MANEIVKMVAKKANIPEPIAQIAVDTVLNMLKSKLPPAIGSTLDSFLGSGAASSSSKTISKSGKTTSKSSKTTAKSSKKGDDLLGGLGNIAGAIGSLLSKK